MASLRRVARVPLVAALVLFGTLTVPAGHAVAAQTIGYPTFSGPAIPAPPVGYRTGGTMRAIYAAEAGGTDFWMDRLLARPGNDPAGPWLMTRGRGLFMYTHNPAVIGFGGSAAYWDNLSGQNAYSIAIGPGAFTEQVGSRWQAPSHWKGVYTNGAVRAQVTKFITHNNVAVTNVTLTNTGAAASTLTLRATSPYATTAAGAELTGSRRVKNDLTTIRPRLAGDGFTPAGGGLDRTVTLAAGQSLTTKVVMGFVTDELPESLTEYTAYRDRPPADAFATHVRDYNRWWADNIPYKYLRDPVYSYGPWLSVGQTSRGGRFVDNPGDSENWSNSYTQYISEAAWRSYQIHGGQPAIVGNLARYAEGDAKGQLSHYDSDHNGVIEYDWGALTGNDADAVSFDWRPGRLDRAETAYVWSGADAARQAYALLGDTAKANEMRALADRIRDGVIADLWNPRYRGVDLSIVWDDPADGVTRYPGVPQGYSVYLDGTRAFTVDRLTRVLYDPATGTVTLPSGAGSVVFSTPFPGLRAPQEVAHTSPRLVDVFAKAGVDLTSTAPNLARGAAVSASYTASGTSTAAAVDGLPTNEPLWGTVGSPNAQDWYEVDFRQPRAVDEVRLYFRDDRAANRYRAPAAYTVQHWNGTAWAPVSGQVRTPSVARANYNRVRFDTVTTQRLRVRVTHAAGFRTALTELKVYRRGDPVPPNLALSAVPSASYTSPWETVAAVNDGIDPPSSNDTGNPRWGTWPNTGEQWAERPAGGEGFRLTAGNGTAEVAIEETPNPDVERMRA